MEKSIHINEDIRLIQQRARPRQVQAFLHLLKTNEKRIKPYFPGFYTDGLSFELVQEMLQNKEKGYKEQKITSYAICSRKRKKIIGEFLIHHTLIDANISYWIDSSCAREGIISLVFDTVREKLFADKVHAIYACCNKKNKPSIRFLKKKGLKQLAEYKNQKGKPFIDFGQTRQEYLFLNRIKLQNER